jgi:hypothetical protein
VYSRHPSHTLHSSTYFIYHWSLTVSALSQKGQGGKANKESSLLGHVTPDMLNRWSRALKRLPWRPAPRFYPYNWFLACYMRNIGLGCTNWALAVAGKACWWSASVGMNQNKNELPRFWSDVTEQGNGTIHGCFPAQLPWMG